MRLYGIDHVQLAMPSGGEEAARSFYSGVLGLRERPKPEPLARRGGLWFEGDGLKLHLGIDREFVPARKAHPALLVEGLRELAERCEAAGYTVTPGKQLEGYNRAYVVDPFGNRLELMEESANARRVVSS